MSAPMRSLREPAGATTAGRNLPGSTLALGAGASAEPCAGTALVTPNGVYGFSSLQPSQPNATNRAAKTDQSSDLLPILIIRVEAPPGLFAEQAGLDQVAEPRARSILRVAEVALEDLGDRQHGIEPDQIGELERPERMTETELGAGVDVLHRADTLFER